MPDIDVDDDTFAILQCLATARNITPAAMLERLIDNFLHRTAEIPVHVLIAGARTEATYFPTSGAMRITTGRWTGHRFLSPQHARAAVLSTALPNDQPLGDAWDFWTVTDTGEPLHTRRGTSTRPERSGDDDVR